MMFSVEQIQQGLDEVRSAIAHDAAGGVRFPYRVDLLPGATAPDSPAGVQRFYYRADTLLRVARALNENDPRRVALLGLIDRAWRRLDLTRPGSPLFYASIAAAEALLAEGLAALDSGEIRPTVVALAHAPVDGDAGGALRTFSAVLALMDEYPELRFAHSSPQVYRRVKQDAPDLYVRIRRRVEEGRWEVLGGSWAEFDAHLPGGEALVRHILLGKRLARQEFEVDPTVVWLPDGAGLAGALPQLMARSGIHYVVTGSPGTAGGERFPYDTFLWRGLDGSQVLVYVMPGPGTGNGNGHSLQHDLSPERVAAAWRDYRHKEVSEEILLPFGLDDGGDGPTGETIERARAQACVPGHPAVRLDTATAFLERLAPRVAAARAGRELPVWDGEVCLGAARGGYSTHGRARRANRRAQALYHDAEWLCSLAAVLGRAPYPGDALRAGWEELLRLQAHHLVAGPGPSSKARGEEYARVTAVGRQALAAALHAVAADIRTEQAGAVVFNSLPWRRGDLVALPWHAGVDGRTLLDEDGRPLPAQDAVDDGGGRCRLVEVDALPAMGYRAYPLVAAPPLEASEMTITPRLLENAHYSIRLNAAGHIVSLFDRNAGREVLVPGARGNVLRVFAACPAGGEACGPDGVTEVDNLVEAAVEEAGPVRGTLRLRWRVGQSTLTQQFTLYRASRRIDFRTQLDWREPRRLLQVAFPVDVRATFATYEVQFGTVERPTHRNTPWDAALAEVPAQRWADLSEGNYGVALLNDGPHGYAVAGHVLALTLRGPSGAPGGEEDGGRDTFTYSLLPHAGTWREAGVAREAAALNHPPYAVIVPARPAGELPPAHEFASVDAGHVTLETIKRAEDGDGWIVRLYEGQQCRRAAVTVTFGQLLRRAVECNLLEEATGPAAVAGRTLSLSIAPYEVKTFRVWFE